MTPPRPPHHASSRPLPEPLARLSALALDIHWAWNHAGDAVWRRLGEALWERTQNPWLLLQHVPFERLESLAADPDFLRDLQALEECRERYHATAPWRPATASTLPTVAYFSMEFGLHEALPLYAGGLGILAGDYLKTASDLGHARRRRRHPLAAGLLPAGPRRGRRADRALPVQRAGQPARAAGPRPGRRAPAGDAAASRAGRFCCGPGRPPSGRTVLYLLDSNDPFNAPADRGLTSTLYGGSSEVRLLQEIILGVGGGAWCRRSASASRSVT